MINLKASVLCIALIYVVGSSAPYARAQSREANQFVEIGISTEKQEYLLGEPVRLDLRVTRKGEILPRIEDDSIATGTFRVFIADRTGDFRRYKFKGWVANRKHHWKGSNRYSFDTVFFNSKPETAHLSDYGKRLAEEGMILTDYAFPKPGDYRINATLHFHVTLGGRAIPLKGASNEISITIKQPQGDDLKVWELINSNTAIGYFMTSGEAPYRFPSIQESTLLEVERIAAAYPESYLAGILKKMAADKRIRNERYRHEAESAGKAPSKN